MMNVLCTRVLALTMIAPATALTPVVMASQSQRLSPAEVVTLHAAFAPGLESLRAGRVASPALGDHERTELRTAQQQSPSLVALRAGEEPTKNTWMWLAIGAGVILLIILL